MPYTIPYFSGTEVQVANWLGSFTDKSKYSIVACPMVQTGSLVTTVGSYVVWVMPT